MAEICRVCLEAVTHEGSLVGGAIRLGCLCSNGREAMHESCATAWFLHAQRNTVKIFIENAYIVLS